MMEQACTRHLEDLQAWFDQEMADLDEGAKSDFAALHEEHWDRAAVIFPQVLRASLFVACHSLLEVKLDELCRSCKRDMKLDLSLSDLKGQGVPRSHAYIKKVARVECTDKSFAWSIVSSLTSVRNVVVHMRGKLTDNKPSLAAREFAKTHPDLISSIGDRDRLEMSDKFCPFVIETYRQLLKALALAVAKPGELPARDVE